MKYLISIWFKRSGWRFIGTLPKRIDKSIMVAGPHVSKKDFLIGVAIAKLTHFRSIILVEQSNFNWYNKSILKALGAMPYEDDNDAANIQSVNSVLDSHKRIVVVLAAHRFRKVDSPWQEFFYDIAVANSIPIVMVALDYRHKQVKFHSHFVPSMDRERDIAFMQNFFERYKHRTGIKA